MTALIIEDETAAALNLKAILRETAPEIEVLDTLESVEESVEWLRRNPHPDLLLTDIHLADGDAFRIFDAVEVASPVVFTTAYDRYALEAFRVNSIDYLLKPLKSRSTRPTCGGRSTSCAASRGANVQPTEPACGRWPHGAPTAYSWSTSATASSPCTATASPGATPGTRRSRPAPTRASSTRSTARSKRSRRSCRPRTSSVPTASSSSRGAP